MDYSQKTKEELIALLEAQQQDISFSRILDNAAVEGALLCSDSVIVKTNVRACKLLGYSEEQLLGMPIEDILPPECIAKLENGSITGDGDCLAKLQKNEGELPAHIRTSLVQLPEGVARLINFIPYESLGLSEKRFQDIHDISPNAVIQVDQRGKLLATNKAGATVFGFDSPEEAVAEGFFVGKYLFEPSDGLNFLKILRKQGSVAGYGFKVKNPRSGRQSWVEVSATPFYKPTGVLSHYEAILRDVTASKVMEIYLKNEKARLNAVFNAIPGPVLLIDPEDSVVVDYNESASQIFGDMKGKKCELGCFSRDEECSLSRLIEVGDTQMALSYWQCCDQDGKAWTVYDVPFLNIDGSPLSLKFMLDISNRVEYEDKLKEARALAEQANQAKSDFLANMSHEIRTPLNGVLGTLQLLVDDGLTDVQRRYVDIAVECGKSLLSLIDSILNISRIDAGRLEVQYVEMNPAVLFKTTTTLCVPEAEKKGLKLDFVADPSLPEKLEGDQERIRQVIFNLIGNAIKFTDKGNIKVSAQLLPQTRGDGTRVLYFTVADTGVGIPPFLIDQAFDVFSQVDGSYTRRHQGAGLGLGIVKRLVKMQGGSIVVDSDGDSGTTIHVTVGVKEMAQEATVEAVEKQLSPDGYDYSSLKVLLAEDEMINRTIAIAMLEKIGCEVVSVSDGNKALEELEHNGFDLIFMDIQMPGCSGIDVTRMLRKDRRYKDKADIPIIAMTAHAMEGDRETFLKAGMDGYVAKPFDQDEIKGAIVEVLSRR